MTNFDAPVWHHFATPQQLAEAQRAAGALREALANAERELSTLKVFSMSVDQEMAAAARRQLQQKPGLAAFDAEKALIKSLEEATEASKKIREEMKIDPKVLLEPMMVKAAEDGLDGFEGIGLSGADLAGCGPDDD